MSSQKEAKRVRKENQFAKRQITEVFNLVVEKQLALPWKLRWRLALRILRGKKSDNA